MEERLLQVRKKLEMTQDELGNKLGVTGAQISRIEKKERKLTNRMAMDICREFQVSYDWLVYGDGDMFDYSDNAAQASIDALMTGNNKSAKALLRVLGQLSDDQWALVEQMMKMLEEEMKD